MADLKTLRPVVDGLWELSAPVKAPGLRMNHRMTVLRLSSGEVVVHSPVAYSSDLAEAVRALGSPAWFVAPSLFHDLYWPEWFSAFPAARFACVPGMKEQCGLPFTDTLTEQSNFWGDEVISVPILGMPRVNECSLLHRATRTLVLADLIFDIDAKAQNAFGKIFLRLNGIYRKPGISHLFRAFIKDKVAFAESVERLRAHRFERTVVGHGGILKGNEVLDRVLSEAGFGTPG